MANNQSKGIKATREAYQRFANATLIIERKPRSGPVETRGGRTSFVGFWAKITDKESDGPKCSWKRMEPKDDHTFEENEDWGKGNFAEDTGWAIEISNSKYVLKDSIVWLEPAFNQDYYVFRYTPGVRIAKTGDDDIPERNDSDKPGSGDVTIWKYDKDTDKLIATTQKVKAFNAMSSSIASDRFVQITFSEEGYWWITAEDCAG